MTYEHADGATVTDGGDDPIRLIYKSEFAVRRMYCEFAERTWHRFLDKGGNYTKLLMLDEQNRVRRYQNKPVAFEGAQANVTPVAYPNIENLLAAKDSDEDLDFDGVIARESTQFDIVKLQLHELLDECRTKK